MQRAVRGSLQCLLLLVLLWLVSFFAGKVCVSNSQATLLCMLDLHKAVLRATGGVSSPQHSFVKISCERKLRLCMHQSRACAQFNCHRHHCV